LAVVGVGVGDGVRLVIHWAFSAERLLSRWLFVV